MFNVFLVSEPFMLTFKQSLLPKQLLCVGMQKDKLWYYMGLLGESSTDLDAQDVFK